MSLLERLTQIGCKLKIIQESPVAKKTVPRKISTRTVSLRDLATEVQAQSVQALAELPAELSVEFDKVFEAAGVKAGKGGWTIERLRQLLLTEPYKTMDRMSVQKAILGLLGAEKAQVEDLVKDAIARDQALDAFEQFVKKKMKDRTTAREVKLAELETQIRTLQKEYDKFKEEGKQDDGHWNAWKQKKLTCEKEMAWAIGFLFEKPVVTID